MTTLIGLEIWMAGTPGELDTAARALARIGRIVQHGARTPLAGNDAGRYRTYARIHVPAQCAIGADAPATDGAEVLPLAACDATTGRRAA